MNRKSFWGTLFGGQKRFSFDDLHSLYNVLVRNPVVTESNKALIIETYRSIAEFMIWGDQNEPRVFEFFLENNVMVYLHKVLLQPSNRRGDVAKQVLQTLSIIIQNVRSETGIFFLFSNNHINNIVELEFDFEDEEVLGYYVSFLKAISLKLNSGTVQFFLDDRGGSMVFPLYTEAIKFAHHKEGMVRAGVRTLTLNVYSVEDHDVQMYITTSGASTYFAELSNYIVDQVQSLDRRFQAAQSGTNANALAALDSQLAELEDMISYVSDIFSVGSPPVAELVSEQLWSALAGPLMFWPLLGFQTAAAGIATDAATSANSQPDGTPFPSRTASNISSAQYGRSSSTKEGSSTRINVWCALYLLERLFHIIAYPPLLHHMLFALLCCSKVPGCSPSTTRTDPSNATKRTHLNSSDPEQPSIAGFSDSAIQEGLPGRTPSSLVAMSSLTLAHDSCDSFAALNTPRTEASDASPRGSKVVGQARDSEDEGGGKEEGTSGRRYCRDVLLGIVNGGDIRLVSATLRLLVAVLQNKNIAPEALYLLGLLPPHKMMQLAGSNPEATHHRLYTWYRQLQRIQESCGACCSYTTQPVPGNNTDAHAGTRGPSAPSMFVMPYDHALSALSLEASLFQGPGGPPPRAPGNPVRGPPRPAHGRNSSLDSAGFPDVSINGSQVGTPDSTPLNSNAPSVVDDDMAGGAGLPADLHPSSYLPLSQGPVTGRKTSASRLAGGAGDVSGKLAAGLDRTAGGMSYLSEKLRSLRRSDSTGASMGSATWLNGERARCETDAGKLSSMETEAGISAQGRPEDYWGEGSSHAGARDTGPHISRSSSAEATSTSLNVGDRTEGGDADRETGTSGNPPIMPHPSLDNGTTTYVQDTISIKASSAEPQHDRTATQASSSQDPPDPAAPYSSPAPSTSDTHDPAALPNNSDPVRAGSHSSFTSADGRGDAAAWNGVTNRGLGDEPAGLQQGKEDGSGSAGVSRSVSQHHLEDGSALENGALDSSPTVQELLDPRRRPQEEEVLDALMQLLLLQTLPASGMWHTSWLLWHLVPFEDGRGKWTEQQTCMFRQALGVARDQVLDELSGMWCEALFPLMYMEWPISREAMLRPVLRASSEALLSGPYAYPLCRSQGPGAPSTYPLSLSATAALTTYHTVLRLIALLQMQQLFQQGSVAKSSPTPAVTDADLRQHDIQEGAHVDLHPGAAIPCIVSFAPGQERRVYFAIAGVSMQRLSTMGKDLDQVGGQTVLHSLPVVILADASTSRLHSGVVLSVAPLLGSDPTTDKGMNRWLHVHVRPPVRGLLRMLKSASAKKGGLLTAMRQLADGHWVLAFPDPDRALNAKMLAQQHAAKLRALYCDVLTPVITTSDQEEADSILIPAGR